MKRSDKRRYFAGVNRLMGASLVRDGHQTKPVGDAVALLDGMPDAPKPVGAPTVIEMKAPTDAVHQLEEIRSWATQFAAAGDLNGQRMEKLVAGVKKAEDLLTEQARTIRLLENRTPAGNLDLRGLSDAYMPVDEAPAGIDRTHFNLTVLRPDEIGIRAVLDRSGMAGLTPHARMFAEKNGMNPEAQARLYEWQYLNDTLLLKWQLMKAADIFHNIEGRRAQYQSLREWKHYARLTREIMRAAMDTATAGEGQEWIPTVFSSQLHLLVQAQLRVASLFQWPTMPAATWKDPVEGADAIAYFVGEATTDPESTNKIPDSVPGTAGLTLTAGKLAARIVLSREYDEDSIVPAVPDVFRRAAKAIARGIEKALIDGQASGNIDTGGGGPAATDARKIWDGLRKIATAASTTVDISGLTVGDLLNMKGAMKGTGKEDHFGYQPEDGAWLPGYSTFIRLMLLKEPTTNTPLLLRLDSFGPGNAMQTGTLGVMLGSPVVITPFMREDLNASGIYDATTTTKTGLLYVNRQAFKGGERRVLTIRRYDELKAETDQIAVIGTWRGGFKPIFGNTAKAVSYGYNVASY